ncbi:MAG TPA: hypothetical protein DCM86_08975 [Verrucomicrobiales bacterium]|nr:hypothetical protein [Verrucomicrobiales bacterium]
MNNVTRLSLISATLLGGAALQAEENPFGYLYTTSIIPRGEWELTQWTTGRVAKDHGSYLGMDFATELETGLTEHLQTALYLKANYHRLKGAQGSGEVFQDRNRFGVSGTSAELKYQLFSPAKDGFGMALYLEPGYTTIHKSGGERIDEIELEAKLLLEKRWMEDRLIGVFNYTLEPEWERGAGQSSFDTNLYMEWGLGLSYRIAEGWRAGVETRVDTEFGGADLGGAEFVSVSAGPSLHFERGEWWATLTVLPQIWGWPDEAGKGGYTLAERERIEVRLKVGVEF